MHHNTVPEPLGHSLSRICRLTHARMYALSGQIGLHRGQSLVLKALSGQDGLTHSELSNLLYVRPATMTNMIKRMEKSGLVERRPDAHDQRVSRVYLTEAGNAIQAPGFWAQAHGLAGIDTRAIANTIRKLRIL